MDNDKMYMPVSAGVIKSDGASQEHQITFVASSANPDRAQEVVEIGSFKLPLKGGGFVRVAELASVPNATLDIPFLANHDGWDIDSVLGSVRSAVYDGERKELTFTVGISSREKAQEMFKLVAEGHLDNAFSIGWRGGAFNPDTKTYTDGEMLEVSLVTRGCNYDARVVATKSTEAEATKADCEDADNGKDNENDQPDQSVRETQAEAPQTETTQAVNNDNAELPRIASEKTTCGLFRATQAVKAQSAEADKPAEAEKEQTTMNDNDTHTEAAKAQVMEAPSQKAVDTTAKNNKGYLASKDAMRDFAKCIVDNHNTSNAGIIKAWKDQLRSKGYEGDEILPTTISQTFFNTFEREDGFLSKVRTTGLLSGAAYAFSTKDRAAGHKKGEKKGDITPKAVRRDFKSKIAFAKMPLDLQDLIDDQTGELTALRAEMLATLLYNEIVRAFIVGDGREQATPDLRIFDGTRGIWSLKADLDKVGSDDYASAVASTIENDATDNGYDKIYKSLRAIKGEGEKVVFVPEGTLTGIALAKDDNGRYQFQIGTDVDNVFKATIYEAAFMDGSGYDAIAINASNILFARGEDMLRSAFDLDYNQDVLLHEKSVAGTAQGWKAVAGYKSAE